MISFYDNYLFIKQVLQSALKLNVQLYTPPYLFDSQLDNRLRRIFLKNFNSDIATQWASLQHLPPNQITCLNSKLGFTTLIYRIPEPFEDALLFVGPFLPEAFTNEFISSILHKNDFPISIINAIQTYYQSLPYIDNETAINTLESLLLHLIPKFTINNTKTYNFSNINEVNLIPEITEGQNFTKWFYDDFISAHNAVFKQIGHDNYDELQKTINDYLQKSGLLNETNIQHLKYALYKFNIKCEYVVLQKKVHYIYIERVYLSFSQRIQEEKNRDCLLLLPQQMIRKYGLVVRNHTLEQYSHTIRKAIDYINLNLSAPLSLSYIANHIGKNASFLSNQFKKETGQTITNFIHEKRIDYAINLINTTNLKIQEIAEKVGILELNYFSKLFKKQVGMSPTEYKKLIN